jgi:hypothetical protein
MLLNRLECALMNNPVRAAVQRHVEARRLLAMGGRMPGGRFYAEEVQTLGSGFAWFVAERTAQP